ncbi:MAG TPA: HWE histidine kinase domain-containing protein [Caulobacteraceae bacterium]|nr:HWE histidine kinase domain-containing protein [Caulobacteraceae bacterium]
MSGWLQYFAATGFIPHGYCLLWRPDILVLHVASDVVIALAYFSIPLAILSFVRRRRDLMAEHRRIAILFGVFILGCGLTHVFGVIVLWYPVYVADGWVKAFTAIVSIFTAAALWPVLPRLLAIPSPSQLASANAQLQDEIGARRQALSDLEAIRQGLEGEVRRRTEEVQALGRRFEIATADSAVTVAEQDASLRYAWVHNPRPPLSAAALGKTDAEVLEPEAAAVLTPLKRQVLETGQPRRSEVVLPAEGLDYHYDVKITPAASAGGPGLLIAAVDITETKRAQAHLQVLMRELSHRAKNLLSLVEGIARQTAKAEALPKAFIDRFAARMSALGGAYDLLIGEDWRGVDLAALAKDQLAFILPDARDRIAIDGPTLVVRPEVGQYLALALHELATNAAKYGALSGPGGRVELRWTVTPAGKASRVELTWVEHWPGVAPAERSGFGRPLLESIVARAVSGEAKLEFAPEGLRWTLSFSQ